jgi:hypothetical protein
MKGLIRGPKKAHTQCNNSRYLSICVVSLEIKEIKFLSYSKYFWYINSPFCLLLRYPWLWAVNVNIVTVGSGLTNNIVYHFMIIPNQTYFAIFSCRPGSWFFRNLYISVRYIIKLRQTDGATDGRCDFNMPPFATWNIDLQVHS